MSGGAEHVVESVSFKLLVFQLLLSYSYFLFQLQLQISYSYWYFSYFQLQLLVFQLFSVTVTRKFSVFDVKFANFCIIIAIKIANNSS